MERKNKVCIAATVLFLVIYAVWRLGWTIPVGRGLFPVLCWVVLTAVEFLGFLELAVFIFEYAHQKACSLPAIRPEDYPAVDVFIFTINEPEELLAKTIYACRQMRYPEPDKVHIYLCDDGARESMRTLTEKMGVSYLARGVNTDAKAGNFNYALIRSRSPLIAIFDADMMPKENFLMKTVPYCVADEKVGFVQTPQHFYRKDIFQRAFSGRKPVHNEQDYFYGAIQKTKNASNSVILAGSNTLLSRAAVEEIGGFVTGTLTEDFSTGIELQKHGYVGIAVTEVLADGLPPMDLKSLIRQRRRWAKGCIQAGRKTGYLQSRTLTLRQKLNYFASIIYWYSALKRLIYMVAPLLFCLAGVGIVRCEPWQIVLFWLPLYGCISLCVYRFSGGIRSLRWTNIYETVFMPFLLPSVLREFFGFHQKTFDVTSKSQAEKDTLQLVRFLVPYVVLLVLNLISLALVLYQSYLEAAYHYVLLIVYLLVNCYYLLAACRVVVGSAANVEGALFDVQEKMEYRDRAETEAVRIRTTAMGEHILKTATYDESWTEGTLRIPLQDDGASDILLPVVYQKNGTWKISPDGEQTAAYQAYLYHLFNR